MPVVFLMLLSITFFTINFRIATNVMIPPMVQRAARKKVFFFIPLRRKK